MSTPMLPIMYVVVKREKHIARMSQYSCAVVSAVEIVPSAVSAVTLHHRLWTYAPIPEIDGSSATAVAWDISPSGAVCASSLESAETTSARTTAPRPHAMKWAIVKKMKSS